MASLVAQMAESAHYVGDLGSIPGSRRSPGEGHGNPLQDSCLENPQDRGVWWASVPRGCKESDPAEQLTLSLSLFKANRILKLVAGAGDFISACEESTATGSSLPGRWRWVACFKKARHHQGCLMSQCRDGVWVPIICIVWGFQVDPKWTSENLSWTAKTLGTSGSMKSWNRDTSIIRGSVCSQKPHEDGLLWCTWGNKPQAVSSWNSTGFYTPRTKDSRNFETSRIKIFEETKGETSLAIQWLRFCAFKARDVGLIPDGGTKIPHVMHCSQDNIKKRKKGKKERKGTATLNLKARTE